MLPLYITTGEPAGIGPEIAAQAFLAWGNRHGRALCLVGDRTLFNASLHDAVVHVPTAQPVKLGELNSANAPYVLSTLDVALHAIETGSAAGMVTCPVHKGVINNAGIAFTGHTEYLAQACCVDDVVMLLADMQTGGLKVALATTHLPLSQVSAAITQTGLHQTLNIISQDMKQYFGVSRPNIWVAGLNPHAGEGGHLGREEIDVIEPAIAAAQVQGLWVSGPYPADTLFCHAQLPQVDVVLAMYHDQGLPVLKRSSFGHAVNITLGLPIIRTSVDHGTALDLAGKGTADIGSLMAAIDCAHQMACVREASDMATRVSAAQVNI